MCIPSYAPNGATGAGEWQAKDNTGDNRDHEEGFVFDPIALGGNKAGPQTDTHHDGRDSAITSISNSEDDVIGGEAGTLVGNLFIDINGATIRGNQQLPPEDSQNVNITQDLMARHSGKIGDFFCLDHGIHMCGQNHSFKMKKKEILSENNSWAYGFASFLIAEQVDKIQSGYSWTDSPRVDFSKEHAAGFPDYIDTSTVQVAVKNLTTGSYGTFSAGDKIQIEMMNIPEENIESVTITDTSDKPLFDDDLRDDGSYVYTSDIDMDTTNIRVTVKYKYYICRVDSWLYLSNGCDHTTSIQRFQKYRGRIEERIAEKKIEFTINSVSKIEANIYINKIDGNRVQGSGSSFTYSVDELDNEQVQYVNGNSLAVVSQSRATWSEGDKSSKPAVGEIWDLIEYTVTYKNTMEVPNGIATQNAKRYIDLRVSLPSQVKCDKGNSITANMIDQSSDSAVFELDGDGVIEGNYLVLEKNQSYKFRIKGQIVSQASYPAKATAIATYNDVLKDKKGSGKESVTSKDPTNQKSEDHFSTKKYKVDTSNQIVEVLNKDEILCYSDLNPTGGSTTPYRQGTAVEGEMATVVNDTVRFLQFAENNKLCNPQSQNDSRDQKIRNASDSLRTRIKKEKPVLIEVGDIICCRVGVDWTMPVESKFFWPGAPKEIKLDVGGTTNGTLIHVSGKVDDYNCTQVECNGNGNNGTKYKYNLSNAGNEITLEFDKSANGKEYVYEREIHIMFYTWYRITAHTDDGIVKVVVTKLTNKNDYIVDKSLIESNTDNEDWHWDRFRTKYYGVYLNTYITGLTDAKKNPRSPFQYKQGNMPVTHGNEEERQGWDTFQPLDEPTKKSKPVLMEIGDILRYRIDIYNRAGIKFTTDEPFASPNQQEIVVKYDLPKKNGTVVGKVIDAGKVEDGQYVAGSGFNLSNGTIRATIDRNDGEDDLITSFWLTVQITSTIDSSQYEKYNFVSTNLQTIANYNGYQCTYNGNASNPKMTGDIKNKERGKIISKDWYYDKQYAASVDLYINKVTRHSGDAAEPNEVLVLDDTNRYRPENDNRQKLSDTIKQDHPVLIENGDRVTYNLVITNTSYPKDGSDNEPFFHPEPIDIEVVLSRKDFPKSWKYGEVTCSSNKVSRKDDIITVEDLPVRESATVVIEVITNTTETESYDYYKDRVKTATITKITNINDYSTPDKIKWNFEDSNSNKTSSDFFRIKSYNIGIDKYVTKVQHTGIASEGFTFKNDTVRRATDILYGNHDTIRKNDPAYVEYGDKITWRIDVFNTTDYDPYRVERHSPPYKDPQYIVLDIKDMLFESDPNTIECKVITASGVESNAKFTRNASEDSILVEQVKVEAGSHTSVEVTFKTNAKVDVSKIDTLFERSATIVKGNDKLNYANINGFESINKAPTEAKRATEYLKINSYKAKVVEYISVYNAEMAKYNNSKGFTIGEEEGFTGNTESFSIDNPLDVEKYETFIITTKVSNEENASDGEEEFGTENSAAKYQTEVRPTHSSVRIDYGLVVDENSYTAVLCSPNGTKKDVTGGITITTSDDALKQQTVCTYIINDDHIILLPGEYIEFSVRVEVTETNASNRLLTSTSSLEVLTNVNRTSSTGTHEKRIVTDMNLLQDEMTNTEAVRLKNLVIAGSVWEDENTDGYIDNDETAEGLTKTYALLYATTTANPLQKDINNDTQDQSRLSDSAPTAEKGEKIDTKNKDFKDTINSNEGAVEPSQPIKDNKDNTIGTIADSNKNIVDTDDKLIPTDIPLNNVSDQTTKVRENKDFIFGYTFNKTSNWHSFIPTDDSDAIRKETIPNPYTNKNLVLMISKDYEMTVYYKDANGNTQAKPMVKGGTVTIKPSEGKEVEVAFKRAKANNVNADFDELTLQQLYKDFSYTYEDNKDSSEVTYKDYVSLNYIWKENSSKYYSRKKKDSTDGKIYSSYANPINISKGETFRVNVSQNIEVQAFIVNKSMKGQEVSGWSNSSFTIYSLPDDDGYLLLNVRRAGDAEQAKSDSSYLAAFQNDIANGISIDVTSSSAIKKSQYLWQYNKDDRFIMYGGKKVPVENNKVTVEVPGRKQVDKNGTPLYVETGSLVKYNNNYYYPNSTISGSDGYISKRYVEIKGNYYYEEKSGEFNINGKKYFPQMFQDGSGYGITYDGTTQLVFNLTRFNMSKNIPSDPYSDEGTPISGIMKINGTVCPVPTSAEDYVKDGNKIYPITSKVTIGGTTVNVENGGFTYKGIRYNFDDTSRTSATSQTYDTYSSGISADSAKVTNKLEVLSSDRSKVLKTFSDCEMTGKGDIKVNGEYRCIFGSGNNQTITVNCEEVFGFGYNWEEWMSVTATDDEDGYRTAQIQGTSYKCKLNESTKKITITFSDGKTASYTYEKDGSNYKIILKSTSDLKKFGIENSVTSIKVKFSYLIQIPDSSKTKIEASKFSISSNAAYTPATDDYLGVGKIQVDPSNKNKFSIKMSDMKISTDSTIKIGGTAYNIIGGETTFNVKGSSIKISGTNYPVKTQQTISVESESDKSVYAKIFDIKSGEKYTFKPQTSMNMYVIKSEGDYGNTLGISDGETYNDKNGTVFDINEDTQNIMVQKNKTVLSPGKEYSVYGNEDDTKSRTYVVLWFEGSGTPQFDYKISFDPGSGKQSKLYSDNSAVGMVAGVRLYNLQSALIASMNMPADNLLDSAITRGHKEIIDPNEIEMIELSPKNDDIILEEAMEEAVSENSETKQETSEIIQSEITENNISNNEVVISSNNSTINAEKNESGIHDFADRITDAEIPDECKQGLSTDGTLVALVEVDPKTGFYTFGRQYKRYEGLDISYYVEFLYDGILYQATDIYGGQWGGNMTTKNYGAGNLSHKWLYFDVEALKSATGTVPTRSYAETATHLYNKVDWSRYEEKDKYYKIDSNAYEYDNIRIAFNERYGTITHSSIRDKVANANIELSYQKAEHVSLFKEVKQRLLMRSRSFAEQDFNNESGTIEALENVKTLQLYHLKQSNSPSMQPETEYLKYINLGLMRKSQQVDISLDADVSSVDTIINGEEMRYMYGRSAVNSTQYSTEPGGTGSDFEFYNDTGYNLDLYKADYEFKVEDYYDKDEIVQFKGEESELNVGITYRICIRNKEITDDIILNEGGQTQKIDIPLQAIINEVQVYYDSDFIHFDKTPAINIKEKNKGKYDIKVDGIGKFIIRSDVRFYLVDNYSTPTQLANADNGIYWVNYNGGVSKVDENYNLIGQSYKIYSDSLGRYIEYNGDKRYILNGGYTIENYENDEKGNDDVRKFVQIGEDTGVLTDISQSVVEASFGTAEQLDKGEGHVLEVKATSKYGASATEKQGYGVVYISINEDTDNPAEYACAEGDCMYMDVTFYVDKNDENYLKIVEGQENGTPFVIIPEISAYSTRYGGEYYHKGLRNKAAATLDRDSNPGNVGDEIEGIPDSTDIEKDLYYEDDTYRICMRLSIDPELLRGLSGMVWNDARSVALKTNDGEVIQYIGNGRYDGKDRNHPDANINLTPESEETDEKLYAHTRDSSDDLNINGTAYKVWYNNSANRILFVSKDDKYYIILGEVGSNPELVDISDYVHDSINYSTSTVKYKYINMDKLLTEANSVFGDYIKVLWDNNSAGNDTTGMINRNNFNVGFADVMDYYTLVNTDLDFNQEKMPIKDFVTISKYINWAGIVRKYYNDAMNRDEKFSNYDKPIEDVKVTLMEMIQISPLDENGNADYYEAVAKDIEGNELSARTDYEGYYEFHGIIPGYYVVRFDYGDSYEIDINGEKETINNTYYNGHDYKSTTFEEKYDETYSAAEYPTNNIGSRLNNPYFDAAKIAFSEGKNSDARDDEIRRLNVTAYTETMTAKQAAIIAERESEEYAQLLTKYTSMFAETPIIYIKPEEVSASTYKISEPESADFEAMREWEIGTIDFGIQYRPEVLLVIDEEIERVTLKTSSDVNLVDLKFIKGSDGVNKIDTKNSKGYNNVQYIPNEREEKKQGFLLIQVEEELLEGATVSIRYDIDVENHSEVDRINTNLEKLKWADDALNYDLEKYRAYVTHIYDDETITEEERQYYYTANGTAANMLAKIYYHFDPDMDEDDTYEDVLEQNSLHLRRLKDNYDPSGEIVFNDKLTLAGSGYYGIFLGQTYYNGDIFQIERIRQGSAPYMEIENATIGDHDVICQAKIDHILSYVDNGLTFAQGENNSKNNSWSNAKVGELKYLLDFKRVHYDAAKASLIDRFNASYITNNRNNVALSVDDRSRNESLTRFLDTINAKADKDKYSAEIKLSSSKILSSEDMSDEGDMAYENLSEIVQYTTLNGRKTTRPNGITGETIGNASVKYWTGYFDKLDDELNIEDDTDATEVIRITVPTGLPE